MITIINAIAFSIFVLLQVADVWTTSNVLEKKAGVEANPIMANIMKLFGIKMGLTITKIALISFVVFLTIYTKSYTHLLFALELVIPIGLYAHVFINNYAYMKKD